METNIKATINRKPSCGGNKKLDKHPGEHTFKLSFIIAFLALQEPAFLIKSKIARFIILCFNKN